MLLYGVCISDIGEINEEKAINFLRELSKIPGKEHYLADFLETKDYNHEAYSIGDWLYEFESDGYYGLSALLKEVIEDVEGIDITCDDPDGVHYLGISADVPWHFNQKTKDLSEQEFENILRKYVNKVTNSELNIRWWSVYEEY